MRTAEVGLGEFWFESACAAGAWFYSNDGDLCAGDNVVAALDTQWAFQQGDTVALDAVLPRGGPGHVAFTRNGAPVPGAVPGVRGPVRPAVMFASAEEGDAVELIHCVVSADAVAAEPLATTAAAPAAPSARRPAARGKAPPVDATANTPKPSAAVRSVRRPNVYTGNGIQLVDEVVRIKQRKASK